MNDLTDALPSPVKSCSTCEHRKGGGEYSWCMLSGYFTKIERKTPTVCGVEFSGWVARRGIFLRIKNYFIGV